jgi:polygalacturonase
MSLFTEILQSKINQCHERGGGVIQIPAGDHEIGSIELKSGVRIYLPEGARLVGVPDLDAYPTLAPTVNESTDIRALIHAENASDIGITGPGIIDGGANRRLLGKEIAKEPPRPELIFLKNCRNVDIRDVHLTNASFWTLHLMHCEDVLIDRITIRNRKDRINTDGIDPDGCKRVRITRCHITTGDDCIVLKSTEGEDCEDILVSDCVLETHCAALKLGTESFGDIRNVQFDKCTIRGSRMAFGIFLKDGGTYETIQVSDLNIEDNTEFPLFIDSTPRFHGESKDGLIREVTLSNIKIKSPGRLFANGSPDHPIEGLRLENIDWTLTGHLELGTKGKPPGSVRFRMDPDRIPHEAAKAQFTLANIKGLSMEGIRILESRNPDMPDRALYYRHNVEPFSQQGISESLSWLPKP